MRGICSGTQTILFSSHQLDEVNKLADDVAIMNRGRVLIHRPLDELLSSFKRVHAVLQDGRLPVVVPTRTIRQSINRREWILTVQDVDDNQHRLSGALRSWEKEKADILRVIGEEE